MSFLQISYNVISTCRAPAQSPTALLPPAEQLMMMIWPKVRKALNAHILSYHFYCCGLLCLIILGPCQSIQKIFGIVTVESSYKAIVLCTWIMSVCICSMQPLSCPYRNRNSKLRHDPLPWSLIHPTIPTEGKSPVKCVPSMILKQLKTMSSLLRLESLLSSLMTGKLSVQGHYFNQFWINI